MVWNSLASTIHDCLGRICRKYIRVFGILDLGTAILSLNAVLPSLLDEIQSDRARLTILRFDSGLTF